MKLPIGSVRAQGWLEHQLKLMSEGFTGRLTEISFFCKFDNNAQRCGGPLVRAGARPARGRV